MDSVFYEKIKDGDLVFRSVNTKKSDAIQYNEFGVLEKTLGKIYVWDNQNTMKMSFQDWINKGSYIKVYSVKTADFNINTLELQNESYNYLMNSDTLELIIEKTIE